MKKLFIGFLFVYLNFHLDLNHATINLLPDFVGYYLIGKGIRELEAESSLFRGAQPFADGMVIYSALLWIGAVLGIDGSGSWVGELLGLIAVIVSLYIGWVLVQGVQDMEAQQARNLNGTVLHSRWKLQLAVQVAGKVLGLMGNLANLSVLFVLSGVLGIAALVSMILYLLAWWKCSDAYENPPEQTDVETPESETEET